MTCDIARRIIHSTALTGIYHQLPQLFVLRFYRQLAQDLTLNVCVV